MGSVFSLHFLGGACVADEAGPLSGPVAQRRRIALLALLAASPDGRMSRERVAAFLWPEVDEESARHRLGDALHAVRRVLGREAVLSVGDELRLNPAVACADVARFRTALADGDVATAARLYAGAFLDGFFLDGAAEFDQWVERERAALAAAHADALEQLAERCAAAGDTRGAVAAWRRLAQHDPLSARVAMGLMRALDAAGDRAEALRHAEAFSDHFTAEMGAAPGPEVAACAAELRARAGAPRPSVAPSPRPAASPSPPSMPAAVGGAGAVAPPADAPVAPPAVLSRAVLPPGGRSPARARPVAALAAIAAVALLAVAALAASSRDEATPPIPAAEPGTVASTGDGTTDRQARALYLRARAAWERRDRDGLNLAVVLFRQATERDPLYAAAHSGLAESYTMLGFHNFAPPDDMYAKARAAAERALALDSTAGGAYAALGQALAWQHEWAASEQAYQRALALDPDNATAHQWYALLLAYTGRPHEAARHTGHAARLDPLSVQINNMHGMMLYFAGHLDSALRQYASTVDTEPDSAWVRRNPWVLCNYGRVATAAGRHEQAVRLIERALEVVPRHPRPLIDLAEAYVRLGDSARARAVFARADTTYPNFTFDRATLDVLLGELDSAYSRLERLETWPLGAFSGLNSDPRTATLRADPRYAALRRRFGFPPL